MGGAGQLLHKLSRAGKGTSYQSRVHGHSATFFHGSSERQQEYFPPYRQQALYVHSSDNEEEQGHGSPPSGMLKRVLTPPQDGDYVKSLPRKASATFSSDSCSSTFTSIHGRFSALSTLPRIPAGGAFGLPLYNGFTPRQGVPMVRFSSTSTGERLEDDLGNIPSIGGNAEVFGVGNPDAGTALVTSKVQAISEVSAVIGDCSYPTAFLQMLMENVHLYTGLPWWAAIVVTTIGIRLACVPVLMYHERSLTKLILMRAEGEKIDAEIKDSDYDPIVRAAGEKRIKGQLAKLIRNMAERVESFKDGGCLWFTDLSSVDNTFILPILLTVSVLLALEVRLLFWEKGCLVLSESWNALDNVSGVTN